MTPLRIAVTGLAATYPFGGVFWDYMQYLLGLHRLGHDVLYVEDTGKWCYDPPSGTFVESGRANAELLARRVAKLHPALKDRWFFRDGVGETFGRPWTQVVEFCRSADLFVNISASCWMREEYFAARRVVFIDSDPMYTQASIPDYVKGTVDDAARQRVDMLLEHDRFFSFGENIGDPDCRIPNEVFSWMPTRQPIVLDCFEPARVPLGSRRRAMTTVASWEPTESGPTVNNITYSGKSTEFLRFIDLPKRSPIQLELAMSGRPPREALLDAGWVLVDPLTVSGDPWAYRSYLANSAGEWSVAKNAYVAGRTGWFSCRSACYLALGVPVVVQDTGFTRHIPSGEGIIAFTNPEEAITALESVALRPEAHSAAALEIAHEHFDSAKVLSSLLERALA